METLKIALNFRRNDFSSIIIPFTNETMLYKLFKKRVVCATFDVYILFLLLKTPKEYSVPSVDGERDIKRRCCLKYINCQI